MPKKPAPKDARKRIKKPGKIADLPAKSLKGKDAAAVKGGAYDAFLKIGGVTGVKMEKDLGLPSTGFFPKVER